MRFIVLDHITATPDAPLSAAFRDAVASWTAVRANAVETSAGHRLAGGLVEFINQAPQRPAGFIVSGPSEADNMALASRGDERDGSSARTGPSHAICSVRLPGLSLWSDELKASMSSRVSRTIEHETSYVFVERLSMQAKGDTAIEAGARVKTLEVHSGTIY